MPTQLPVNVTSSPVSTQSSNQTSSNGADTNSASEETQNFMSMLSQLLDEGAVVVAAPAQGVQPLGDIDNQEMGENADALPMDESLLSMLIPSQMAQTPASLDAQGKRVTVEPLPNLMANLAALQKTANRPGGDKVTLEFQATLSAQTADALLNGAELGAESDAGSADAGDGLHLNGSLQALTQQSQHALRAQLPVEARVGSPAWGDELAAKAFFVHERGMQSASLRLSPEHLGPMEIQITVKDDKASVWFGAAHAETRAALEQALPRLREMLNSQGLSLSDAGVFREPPRDQARAYVAARTDNSSAQIEQIEVVVTKRNALLDAYA